MRRTRSQKPSTPLTVARGNGAGVRKETSPFSVNASVPSVHSNATQRRPSKRSHWILGCPRLLTGGMGAASPAEAGFVSVILSVILAPGVANASLLREKASPNRGHSPKGKKSLERSSGTLLKNP